MRRILESFNNVKALWKIIIAIYIFQFLLAATVGLQMKQVLDASIGNSLSLQELTSGFDYTVFSDFVNVHGGSFSVLFGQMRWMALIYLIFASFISAGTIYILANKSKEYLDFFKGGARYFGRFFMLDVAFTIVISIILVVAFGSIGYLFSIANTDFDTELTFLRLTLLIVLLSILLSIILTVWKIKSKFHYLNSEDGLFRSLGKGFVSFWNHKWKMIFYSLLFLAVSLFLLYVNLRVGSLPLLLMILIQQIIILFKILWRMMYYDVVGRD